MGMNMDDILDEDRRRMEDIRRVFNPVTGEGSTGERAVLALPDFPIPVQYVPTSMLSEPYVQRLVQAGSVRALQ